MTSQPHIAKGQGAVVAWRGRGGVLGFCERDALIMHVIADMIRKTEFLYFI